MNSRTSSSRSGGERFARQLWISGRGEARRGWPDWCSRALIISVSNASGGEARSGECITKLVKAVMDFLHGHFFGDVDEIGLDEKARRFCPNAKIDDLLQVIAQERPDHSG